MRFVETPTFTRVITALLNDESYRELQSALMHCPDSGPTIAGANGARKLRWGRDGMGKRGGLRVIYSWAARETTFYTLYAYSKNEQGDLTRKQAKLLGALIREEFK